MLHHKDLETEVRPIQDLADFFSRFHAVWITSWHSAPKPSMYLQFRVTMTEGSWRVSVVVNLSGSPCHQHRPRRPHDLNPNPESTKLYMASNAHVKSPQLQTPTPRILKILLKILRIRAPIANQIVAQMLTTAADSNRES